MGDRRNAESRRVEGHLARFLPSPRFREERRRCVPRPAAFIKTYQSLWLRHYLTYCFVWSSARCGSAPPYPIPSDIPHAVYCFTARCRGGRRTRTNPIEGEHSSPHRHRAVPCLTPQQQKCTAQSHETSDRPPLVLLSHRPCSEERYCSGDMLKRISVVRSDFLTFPLFSCAATGMTKGSASPRQWLRR